jgi:hypothetical protein
MHRSPQVRGFASSRRGIVPIVACVLDLPRLAILTAVGAVSIAPVVTASAGAATPTRASWSAAANAICRSGNAQIRILPTGMAPAVRASTFRAIAQIVTRENAKLSVLPRPASELPNITFFLSKARALVTLYVQAARAEEAKDKPAIAKALTTIEEVRYYHDFAARVLGARVCADVS